jgi:hypothetical protein
MIGVGTTSITDGQDHSKDKDYPKEGQPARRFSACCAVSTAEDNCELIWLPALVIWR